VNPIHALWRQNNSGSELRMLRSAEDARVQPEGLQRCRGNGALGSVLQQSPLATAIRRIDELWPELSIVN